MPHDPRTLCGPRTTVRNILLPSHSATPGSTVTDSHLPTSRRPYRPRTARDEITPYAAAARRPGTRSACRGATRRELDEVPGNLRLGVSCLTCGFSASVQVRAMLTGPPQTGRVGAVGPHRWPTERLVSLVPCILSRVWCTLRICRSVICARVASGALTSSRQRSLARIHRARLRSEGCRAPAYVRPATVGA